VIFQRDIVLLTFPFSDLKSSKVRPAIVLSNDKYNRRSEDFVAVPLTSNLKLRDYAFFVTNEELESGNLIVDSKVKVDRVFSVSQRLVRMKIGRIKPEVHERITRMLFGLLHVT
jgi:mRNA-degrading endonuclease toxin of MazEF toxin-antitoxin module